MPDSIALGLRLRDDSRRGITSFTTGMNRVKRSARGATTSVDRLSKSTMGLGNALRLVAVGLSVRQLSKYSDTWKRVTNQLRVVEKTALDVAKAQERVFKISQDTRQSLEGTTALYTRMKRAQDTLKVSNEDLETVVVAVNKGIAASGATTKEAEAGLIQLSQAFMSGKLAGDELRSVMENIPIIAQAMAKGLGIPFEEFRDQAKNLKPAQLVAGLLKSAEDLENAFGRTQVTIGQSFQMFENAVVKYIGQLDEALNLSNQFADVMAKVGRNMDKVVIAIGAMGGALSVLAASGGMKALFNLFALLTPGGALARVGMLGLMAGGGYMGAELAGGRPKGGEEKGWLDQTVRTGSFGKSPLIGEGNAENWHKSRREGTFDVTRRDHIEGFMKSLSKLPDVLIKSAKSLMSVFGNIVSGIFKFLADRIKLSMENNWTIFKNFIENIKLAFVGLGAWIGDWWKLAVQNSVKGVPFFEGAAKKLLTGESEGYKEVRERQEKLKAKGLADQASYEAKLAEIADPVGRALENTLNGMLNPFKKFAEVVRKEADLISKERTAAAPLSLEGVTSTSTPKRDWGKTFESIVAGTVEGLDMLSVALAGVDPQLDAMIAGVSNIAQSLMSGNWMMAAAQGFNLMLMGAGVAKNENVRLVDALERTAEASRIAADTLERLSLSLQDLSMPELEKRSYLGNRFQEMIKSILDDGLDIEIFTNLSSGLKETLRDRYIDTEGEVARLIAMSTRSELVKPLSEFFNLTSEEFLEFTRQLKEAFDGLPFGANQPDYGRLLLDPLKTITETSEEQMSNFGDVLPDTFAAAVERFRHDKAVQRPIGDALIALFKDSFKAIIDFPEGTFNENDFQPLIDLTGREYSRFEEMIVDTRLEAAREGANKLIAGYRTLAEMESAERFQADIVQARSTLATDFGLAENDVYKQRDAIEVFKRTLQSIRDSITLARGRAVDEVGQAGSGAGAGSGTGGSGGSGGTGGGSVSPSGKIVVDLGGGNRVEIVRHRLDSFSEIFDGAVMNGLASLQVDLSSKGFGRGVEIIKHNLKYLYQVFTGDVMDQTAPFTLNMNAGDRTKIEPYALTSLADVFMGGVIDQTAPFRLDMNAGTRTSINPYPLTSLANVFKGGVIDQSAPFELDMNSPTRTIDIKKKLISNLSQVFDFRWNPQNQTTIPLGGNVRIDPQIITSVDQLIDTSQLGEVKLSDFVHFTVSPHDFFFKAVDQIEEIGNALNIVFENFPTQMKAQVPLAELVDFRSEGLRPALFQAVNEGIADGQITEWVTGK